MRFSQRVLLLAGMFGLLKLVPLYFYEGTLKQTQAPRLRLCRHLFTKGSSSNEYLKLIATTALGSFCRSVKALLTSSNILNDMRASWRAKVAWSLPIAFVGNVAIPPSEVT